MAWEEEYIMECEKDFVQHVDNADSSNAYSYHASEATMNGKYYVTLQQTMQDL